MALRWVLGATAAGGVRIVSLVPGWVPVPRWPVSLVERLLLAHWGQGLFDPAFYRDQNGDLSTSGMTPLTHYLRHGWREGRAPNRHFDDGHYRALSHLSPRQPVSALAHYVALGQFRGMTPVPAAGADALGQSVRALEVARLDGYRGLVGGAIPVPEEGRPDLEEVREKLEKLDVEAPERPVVDIVIPVYDGHAETLNTILHVLSARNRTIAETIVIADRPPVDALLRDLSALADRRAITLITNDRNLGFAGSINRGMALHGDRDVIWLNADTEVYDTWIDRLRATAYSRGNVATVTPLTNNGTICSYPRFDADNFGAMGLPWDRIDRQAARLNAGEAVESPTAVGFATYVRRAAIDRIGSLDAETFGRGYGEENDWSQRAIKAGWINLLAPDVLVRHFGATSFGGERARRIDAAMAHMDRLHPNYRRAVADFARRDPLAPARRRLDLARLMADRTPRAVLLISHLRGGGTAQHVHEETARLLAEGWTVFHLTAGSDGPRTARLTRAGAGPLPSFEALALDGDEFWALLKDLGLKRADLHHLIDFSADAPEILRRRLGEIGVPYRVTVHDYFAICPRINLVDRSGRYCGEPDDPGCQRCLNRRGSAAGRQNIAAWRARHGKLLRDASLVRVPDDDVAMRLRHYFPEIRPMTVPHDQATAPPVIRRAARPGKDLHIAVLGAIGPIKGFDVILGLARHIGSRGLDHRITVIGYTHNDMAARAAGIHVTGAYANDRLPELIAGQDPDVIWIPSLWPETYCYTLSAGLRSGRAVVAFDLGAQAGRLRAAGRDSLVPLTDAFRPERLLAAMEGAAAPRIIATQSKVA